ncbi:MAG: hypothetical protein NW207_09125 [Cytophagales bacterium]|nr:hypothetical protein [Cytophagales bacterium]
MIIRYTISTCILLFYAFFNGYPLLFIGDSFGYYHYGRYFDHDTGAHSFIYGLFVALCSLHKSFWIVAITQCWLTSVILYHTAALFLNKKNITGVYYLIIIVLALFTSLTKYTGKIMPDLYTGLIPCCIFLLFYGNYNKYIKAALYILVIIFISFHNSFVFVCACSFGLYIIYMFRNDKLKQARYYLWILVSLPILSAVITITTHFVFFSKPYFNKVSHIYLLAKLSDMGILKKYLDENCDIKPNLLCKYNQGYLLFNDFMYNSATSPTHREYGYYSAQAVELSREPYTHIINDILSQPKYLSLFIFKGLSGTVKLLADFSNYEQSGDIMSWHFDTYLPNEKIFYVHSKQYHDKLKPLETFTGTTEFILVSMSILYMIYITQVLKIRVDQTCTAFIILISCTVISNALVCGTLAELVGRFSQRLIWLIPYAGMLFVAKYYSIK